ncbi:MAG: acetyl-CoA carboxylase, carboxyltransferase subunit beta [Elusimicrobiota bacterium]|nr:acetyl-CoA carboxylase, carboxyltransferase subunit beta [Elusimicrobiota bacterium]
MFFFIKKSEDGLWMKCAACNEITYKKQLVANSYVCAKCGNYFRIGGKEYLNLLSDTDSFTEYFSDLKPADPLGFYDVKKYSKKLKEAQKKTGDNDAFICGMCTIAGAAACIGVLNFVFMGGSMGSVVGEKITMLVEKAIKEKLPVVIVSASGGARMQEGILSLMQMAKTSGALAKLDEAGLPFISVLTNPTTGGVSASFAFLGDVIISEPKALIGFAGPRVIEQTIRQKLPEGFQKAEFLLEKGQIDMIVERSELKEKIAAILNILKGGKT